MNKKKVGLLLAGAVINGVAYIVKEKLHDHRRKEDRERWRKQKSRPMWQDD